MDEISLIEVPASRPALPMRQAEAARVKALSHVTGRDLSPEHLDSLRDRLGDVADPTSPQGLEELRQHLPILEALFLQLVTEASAVKVTDYKVRLVRAALQAQQAHARTFALLRTLALQNKGETRVTDLEGQ